MDLKAGTVKNLTSGKTMKFSPYPDFLLEIIEAGGLYPLLRKLLPKGEVPMYARIPGLQ